MVWRRERSISHVRCKLTRSFLQVLGDVRVLLHELRHVTGSDPEHVVENEYLTIAIRSSTYPDRGIRRRRLTSIPSAAGIASRSEDAPASSRTTAAAIISSAASSVRPCTRLPPS